MNDEALLARAVGAALLVLDAAQKNEGRAVVVRQDLLDVDIEAHGHDQVLGLRQAMAQVGVQLGVGLDHGLVGGVAADLLGAQHEQLAALFGVLAALVPVAALAVLAQLGAVLVAFEIAVHHQFGGQGGTGPWTERTAGTGASRQLGIGISWCLRAVRAASLGHGFLVGTGNIPRHMLQNSHR